MNIEQLLKDKKKKDLQKICTDLKISFDPLEVNRTLAEKIKACAEKHPDLTAYYDAEAGPKNESNEEGESKESVSETAPKSELIALREECAERGIEYGEDDDVEQLLKHIAKDDDVKIEAAELNSLQEQATQHGIQFTEETSKAELKELIDEANEKISIEQEERDRKDSAKEATIKQINEMEVDFEFLNDMADYLVVACKKMQKQMEQAKKSGERFGRAAEQIVRLQKSHLIK